MSKENSVYNKHCPNIMENNYIYKDDFNELERSLNHLPPVQILNH